MIKSGSKLMRSIGHVSLILMVLTLGPALASGDEPYSETLDETYALAATGTVSLENINGDVQVAVWDRSEVRVEAVKQADTLELLEKLKIEIDARPNRVAIDTDYPNVRGSHKLKVEYTLTVPRGAEIDSIELINGDLDIAGVEGPVEVSCINGTVKVEGLRGAANLSTVNGGLEVYYDYLDADAEIESVNGRIDLYLPSSVSAELTAETVNGRISNDLGLQVHKGKYVGSDLSGVLGGGAFQVELSTVNGRIEIHSN